MQSVTYDTLDYILSPIHSDGAAMKLIDAIRAQTYSRIYALIRKCSAPFGPEAAFWLCYFAFDCSPNVLKRLLPLCPPPDRFLYQHSLLPWNFGLPELAAYYDRTELVELFLQLGIDPNGSDRAPCSLVEAAMQGRSLATLELLLAQPGIEVRMTPYLLNIWARLNETSENPMLAWCCRCLADHLYGPDDRLFEPVRLPSELDLIHAARQNNWPLFIRLCRERPIKPKQAIDSLRHAIHIRLLPEELVNILLPLLDGCPTLLRRRLPRWLLVCLALHESSDIDQAEIQRRLDRMPGREIVVNPIDRPLFFFDIGQMLGRWNDRLGDRFRPVLDTAYPLPELQDSDRSMMEILKRCRITGRRCTEHISRLSRSLIYDASPTLLCVLLQSDSPIVHETPRALQDFLRQQSVSEKKRSILQAHIQKEESYAL